MPKLNDLPLPELYRTLAAGGLVRRLVELARDEDLGAGGLEGDITSRVCVAEGSRASASLVARAAGTIAGLAVLPEVVSIFGGRVELRILSRDGAVVGEGTILAELSGPRREILSIERTALNFVGRLSGIATRTAEFVRVMTAGGPVRARLYDIRKTTPGLRVLEKYAVRCGGGMCHRIGLFDAVLIKDNHIAGVGLEGLAATVASAARKARAERRDLQFVEVEVESLAQLERVLAIEPGLIDIVLLDNMSTDLMRRAVAMRDAANGRVELEASGGVRLETVRGIAETGVDRISAGTLTHGASSLDVALDLVARGDA